MPEQGKVLGFELTIYHISKAIGSLWHLYRELDVPDDEVITINFIFLKAKDRNLVVLSPSRAGFMSRQVCRSPQISVERQLPLEEWQASEVDIALEISIEVFQQFQWIEPNLNSIRTLVSNLLAKG